MPNKSRRWRRGSRFDGGLRIPLDRERRAVWRARLVMFKRARKLTPLFEDIGLVMLRRLSVDGQLDPSHETIADDVGCSTRSVQRALAALKAIGLLRWANRIIRVGRCVEQTSNAYALTIGEAPAPDGILPGGQAGRGILRRESLLSKKPREATDRDAFINAARQLLAMGVGIPAHFPITVADLA